MTEQELLDFDALYQGKSVRMGEDGPTLEGVPWQLDGPQPLVIELAKAGEFTGPVLEIGCGLGDNALFLAEQGLKVTAVDASPTAIERNQAKAAARGADVTFAVADATVLDGVGDGFASALDSALMHCLSGDQRRAYLAALHDRCRPGARLHILCFPETVGAFFPLAADTDEASLRRDLGEHWRVERMEIRRYTTNFTRDRWLALVPDAAVEFDDNGHVLLPIWQITAVNA
ncbi:class I SAM-dependent methyltransferase [Kutzneria sp. CA-103260]|uniref:class I SAM-dependent methyltransferase n=1 Tax=Kutzneria sp. CA-103260 TaxID=2802641 RepID=UPI001BEED008|nr:class I SAM-dependent methyltransferase [Kutzneria sp. CA-103260]QUQ68642.1 transferase [Kutzneria sp. CA-103260]